MTRSKATILSRSWSMGSLFTDKTLKELGGNNNCSFCCCCCCYASQYFVIKVLWRGRSCGLSWFQQKWLVLSLKCTVAQTGLMLSLSASGQTSHITHSTPKTTTFCTFSEALKNKTQAEMLPSQKPKELLGHYLVWLLSQKHGWNWSRGWPLGPIWAH